jgi:hypothetical protein
MTIGPTDIVNRAIELIGNNAPLVTGTLANNFGGGALGIMAATLYPDAVNTVGREFGWDFSRNIATLSLSGNSAPLGFAYEYVYPASGIQVRQLIPPTITDANDPLPIDFTVGYASISGQPTKVIWTNLQNAVASISGLPPESVWDPGYTAAVVRFLASGLAMAGEGRPETSRDMAKMADQTTATAEERGA